MSNRWTLPTRIRFVGALLAAASYLVVVGPILVFQESLYRRGLDWLLPVLCFLSVPGVIVGVLIWRRAWARPVVEKDLCACLYCRHNLRGIGDRGMCPECGKAFVLEAARDEWAALLGRVAKKVGR